MFRTHLIFDFAVFKGHNMHFTETEETFSFGVFRHCLSEIFRFLLSVSCLRIYAVICCLGTHA